MEYEQKSLGFEIKAINKSGMFEGYASTRKKDSYGDIVEKGAFKRTIDHSKGVVPLLWFHDPYTPIGMTKGMHEDTNGLFITGELDLDIEQGRNVHSGMSKGYIDRMSIGYNVEKKDYDKDTRYLKEIILLEVSPVTRNFAANDTALITGVKNNLALASELKSLGADLKELIALLRKPDALNSTPTLKDALTLTDSHKGTQLDNSVVAEMLATIQNLKTTLGVSNGT
jgi:HK97 family phage prohead protease